jgi:glycine dehydrogenase
MSAPSFTPTPIAQLLQTDAFIDRHIGPSSADNDVMLRHLNVSSMGELLDETVPDSIRLDQPLNLPSSQSEVDTLAQLKTMASKNIVNVSCIGMGYSNTLVPNVILRNVMENPAWYTAYTPYQPEIAQGRVESILY